MISLSQVYMGLKSPTMKHVSYAKLIRCLQFIKLYSTDTVDKIVIPNRIPRGPTDLLRALSNTVQYDPTAAHYKYHDDPYLTPMSNIGKRTFAMSQEAGRKAAMFIRDENPHLFQHVVADPPISAFAPKAVYNENSEVSVDILQSLIKECRVSDAVVVYNLLKQKESVPDSLSQALLELLCYYNHEEPLDDELIEERWFRQGNRTRDRQRNTWKNEELANTIFNSIEPKSSAAYCAIIRGMTKYFQVERAWALHQEALENGIEIDTESYNGIIRASNFLRDGNELRWALVKELLTSMNKQKLKPNLSTLNAVLEAISTMGGHKQTRAYALQTIAEFKKLGIEPSLASWYHVINIFCRERGPVSSILIDILNNIEGKEFTISDPKDTYFFVTAMDVCRHHLADKDVAKRVDKLLHTGENYNLIGDSYKESIYYRHYFVLLCNTEPLEVFMEYYDKLVPNIYIPEPGVMEEVLKAIDLNGAVELLPRIWSHMVIFDHTSRESLIIILLKTMINNKTVISDKEESNLVKQFGDIAWGVYEKIEGQPEQRIQRISWSGDMLGDILTLVLRAEDFDKASIVMNKLTTDANMGLPNVAPLQLYLEQCIIQKQPSKAIACVQYCADHAFTEVGMMAKQIVKEMTLDEGQLGKLTNIVGQEVLKN